MVFKFNIIQIFYYYYFGSGVNTMNTAMSKQLWYLHCWGEWEIYEGHTSMN